jgi:hypothetical protein
MRLTSLVVATPGIEGDSNGSKGSYGPVLCFCIWIHYSDEAVFPFQGKLTVAVAEIRTWVCHTNI